ELHVAAELQTVHELLDVGDVGLDLLFVPPSEHIRVERDPGEEIQDHVGSVTLNALVRGRRQHGGTYQEERVAASVLRMRLHPAVVALDAEVPPEPDAAAPTEP